MSVCIVEIYLLISENSSLLNIFLGIDNTVCTYGSVVEFRKGTSPKMIPIKAIIEILLINSKVQRETKTLVAKVSQIRHKYPNAVDNILKAIEEIAVMAVYKLEALSAEEGMLLASLPTSLFVKI